jgi:nucleoside-diphosphate-sugar epimerase
MKVFLAGATGAIGKQLVPLLVGAGHTVTGTTRHTDKADSIRKGGATAVVMDALNARDVREAVERARPDAIIHELTAIPAHFNFRQFDKAFAMTNRLRREGTDNLLAAAKSTGVLRFIAQSYAAFPYGRTGGWIKDEGDPLLATPDPGMSQTFEAIRHVESAVLNAQGIEGIVLRYGAFYGPGTSMGPGGSFLEDIRRRRMPIVGNGAGHWSFIHIEDAARATVLAVSAGVPGIYNIVDDEPAPVAAWLPALTKILGAKPPRHVPTWVARVLIGQHGVAMMTQVRGASNEKAKRLLHWKLKWPSWRHGFRGGLNNVENSSRFSLPKAG